MPRKTKATKKQLVEKVEESMPVDSKCTEKEVEEIVSVVQDEIKSVEKAQKKKRAPSKYNLFVKDKMKLAEIKDLPPKERMGAIAAMWKTQK